VQIARPTGLRPDDFLSTVPGKVSLSLRTSRCDEGPIFAVSPPTHENRMNELAAHALVRASFLITNIERLVAQGDLSTTDAKQLLGQLSSLLARLPSPQRPTAHT
jgi:hypothetical protein